MIRSVCCLLFSSLLLTSGVATAGTVLLGFDIERDQASAQLARTTADGTAITASFTRHSVLLGERVPGLFLVGDVPPGSATSLQQAAALYIPGMPHPIPGVEQQALGQQSFIEYTLVTLRLAPGVSFAQCEAQMAKVLKLAKRYGAQPLETWRVMGAAKGLPDADLFGLVGWQSGASALRFALKLRSEGQGIRPAHDLNDDNALVVQVKPI